MKHKAKGFSLIELMVTIVIVSILLSVGIPSYTRYRDRVRLINSHIALHKAIQEAFSAARSRPESFAVILKKTPIAAPRRGSFTLCRNRPDDDACAGADVIQLEPDVFISEVREGRNYDTPGSFGKDNRDIDIKFIFKPPYGALSFMHNQGGFRDPGSIVQFYDICLSNPSPIKSMIRVWETGLIETGLDKQLLMDVNGRTDEELNTVAAMCP